MEVLSAARVVIGRCQQAKCHIERTPAVIKSATQADDREMPLLCQMINYASTDAEVSGYRFCARNKIACQIQTVPPYG